MSLTILRLAPRLIAWPQARIGVGERQGGPTHHHFTRNAFEARVNDGLYLRVIETDGQNEFIGPAVLPDTDRPGCETMSELDAAPHIVRLCADRLDCDPRSGS